MTALLSIGKDIKLPPDLVTSTVVVLGGKGMGKTVLGSVLAEELAKAGLRWAWLDPLGVAYGIRHSADGKGKGVECLILGGPHGDIPIYPDGGAAVADVVVEESGNVLIDFSRKPSGEMWSVGEKIRFVTAYARRLFQRQGDLLNGRRREPLFQILDEAARYIPQNIPAGNIGLAECVGAWQQFCEEGRNIGLGVCFLTQRSARINKDVSELADAMFAFRTVAPRSLGAVLDWLGEHVDRERVKQLGELVRKLDKGSALLVSPGWLNIEKVVHIRMRNTFDSSATPKAGQRARTAKGPGAKPDLGKIRERMAASIERAKEDDPKELRRQIAELKKTQKVVAPLPPPAPKVKTVEVPILKAADRKLLDRVSATVDKNSKRWLEFTTQWNLLTKSLQALRDRLEAASAKRVEVPVEKMVKNGAGDLPPWEFPKVPGTPQKQLFVVPREEITTPDGKLLTKCERALLVALAQRSPAPSSAAQVSILSGYSQSSSGFANGLSALRVAGLLEGGRDALRITDKGLERAGAIPPIPTGEERVAFWNSKLQKCERQLLAALVEAYPKVLSKAELSAASGYSVSSSGFANGLSKLRVLELIHGRDELRASEELFC